MKAAARSLIVPAIFTIAVGVLLVGLGVWQLHRLAWKEAILARIESRTTAAPQPLPPQSSWLSLRADDYEYRRVFLDGTFRNDKETLVFHGSEQGPGYLVLTPFDLRGGGTVIVNRGFVTDELKEPDKRRAGRRDGEVRIAGLMREPQSRNLFTPADEPARGIFFTRDPGAIGARLGLGVAPFTVDADATPNPGGWPRGGTTEVSIPNNHLQYALTWFGLALGLIGVFLSFAWRRFRSDPEARSSSAPGIAIG